MRLRRSTFLVQLTIGLSLFIGACFTQPIAAQDKTSARPITIKPLARVAGGVKVPPASGSQGKRWNRTVLLSKPKLSSGDLDVLSSLVRESATVFDLTILATVSPPKGPDGKFVLADVGVTYSMPISGVQTVVTSETQKTLGANLDFVQRRVLSSSESQLATLRSIIHTSTLLMFDAPSVVLRKGNHRKYISRHFIWIDPATGKGATLMWLLGKDAAGKLQPINEPLRLVAHGTIEQRKIHVDGNEFTIGFPSERAFAMEDLPPGQKVNWTRELVRVAAREAYTVEQSNQLFAAINAALTPQ